MGLEVPINKQCVYCGKQGSYSKKFNINLCPKHYYQMNKFGHIITTKYDKNPINVYDETIGIITIDSQYNITGEFIIDKDDYDLVKNIRWRMDSKGYAFNNSNKSNPLYLHRLINHTPDNEVCDHIDRNKFNCRKRNLRSTTFRNNCINNDVSKNNTSGVRGVDYDRRNNKWRVRMWDYNKAYGTKYFDSYIDAVKYRLLMEYYLYGEYSPLYNNGCISKIIKYNDKVYNISIKQDSIVPTVSIKEVSYDELKLIESERGMGALGSSNK